MRDTHPPRDPSDLAVLPTELTKRGDPCGSREGARAFRAHVRRSATRARRVTNERARWRRGCISIAAMHEHEDPARLHEAIAALHVRRHAPSTPDARFSRSLMWTEYVSRVCEKSSSAVSDVFE